MQTFLVIEIAAAAAGYLLFVVYRALRSGGRGCCSAGCLDAARQQDRERLAGSSGDAASPPCQCPSGDKSAAGCGPCGKGNSSAFANLPILEKPKRQAPQS